jgi:hypothetical protein
MQKGVTVQMQTAGVVWFIGSGLEEPHSTVSDQSIGSICDVRQNIFTHYFHQCLPFR